MPASTATATNGADAVAVNYRNSAAQKLDDPGSDNSQLTATAAAGAAAAAANVPDLTATPGVKKTAAGGADDEQADAGGTAVSNAAAAANPSAPVAAVVVLNTAVDATPAAANASASSAAIGAQSGARVQAALLRGAGQDTPSAPGAADIAWAKPAPAADTAAGAAATKSGSSDPANGPVAGTPAQQPPPRADSATPPQTDPSAQISIPADAQAPPDLAAAAAAAAATAAPAESTGSTSAQSATGALKAATADLQNFALAPANAVTPQATTATPGTPPAAAIPVSGLAVTIAARAQAGSNQFDIRLDPPELGRIDVRLDVNSDGQVTSHVTVDRPETLTLLQSQQPQLERALEQAGLKTVDNGLQFSLRDQSFTGQNNSGGGAQQSAPQLVIPDPDLAPVETRPIYSRAALGGGIDIRV